MKILTIGRGDDNDIILHDDKDMISRQHATLRIHDLGKMEIISTGVNGTFVNGYPIKPNVPHKVTRKDVISFAHIRQLDWALVPDPLRIHKYVAGGILLLVAIGLIIWGINKMFFSEETTPAPLNPEPVSNTVVVPESKEGNQDKPETTVEEGKTKKEEKANDKFKQKRKKKAESTEDKEKKEQEREEQPKEDKESKDVAVPIL